MRRAGIVLVGWGAWLGVMTAVQAAFRSVKGPFGVHWIEAALLGGAAAASIAGGALLWALDARTPGREKARALTTSSFATAALTCGLAIALIGAGFGLWLILIGAGVGAFGMGGLVRESIARGHARRERGVR